ncbi:glycosyltransferase family 4 protein [Romeria aff. gracilis LEGE 07310]|uniref:Glycosyltransferase family 4 protein n=1 Tax=Vasconcelosia minhoensis LEGE 07310 TaxID=915328 RepID=A0A8J7ALK4_9CYAN|nr:glycosyltransferase family 1 protein [Romeria gracilis]MBE9080143.1 glycosyltransferase family 4 protein [Romeria aff. gracilis LEGE 07310]
MHILILALHSPTEPTGVCRYAVNLAHCLADLDLVKKITFVTGSWQRYYYEEFFSLSSSKIELVDVNIKNNSPSRNLWFLFEFPNLAKKCSAEIIHLAFPLPFIRSRFSCPVIATVHDFYPYQLPENFGRKKAFFNRLILKQCVHSSDGLACVSKTTLGDLKKYFPVKSNQKPLAVTYNLVNFENVVAKPPNFTKEKFNRSFILSVAQHRKNKNLDLLIRSFSVLKKDDVFRQKTPLCLVLVGASGPETNRLNQLVKDLSLDASVFMISAISESELCWLYQNCEVFVIASSIEGFCIPLIEALYFSCKSVCSDIPVLREIGLSNCVYFDLKRNALDNLTQAIRKAISSESCHQTAVREELKNRFSKQETVKECINIYSKAINS